MATILVMRVYEIILKSGAKAELQAEVLHDDSRSGNKIYFYNDKNLKQVVAYFNRADVAGVIFGPEKIVIGARRQ